MYTIRTIERQCLHCLKIFQAPIKEVNRGNAKYCSMDCVRRLKRERKHHEPNVACAYCNKKFYADKDRITASKSGLFFCCRAHKDLSQRIGGIKAIQPDHYGSGICNYRDIARRNLIDACNRCGYNKFTVVHHKDRNRSNNALDNLEILCPNCHALEHWGKD